MMKLTDSAFKLNHHNRWFIWGMPLSGKSSLGKKLKKQLSFPVFDLDKEIERLYRKSIPEIFAEGEVAFREKESVMLKQLVHNNIQFVIVVGGGTPCFQGNAEFMLNEGDCFFMNTSLAVLFSRVKENHERPLLQGNAKERLEELYTARLPIYQKAHVEFYSEKEMLDWLMQC